MADHQSLFFRGIYEFDDPAGALLAARVPAVGTADLYAGTHVVVKPGQSAIFIYNGQIAEVLPPGNHEIQTGNLPVLSRLANWRFDFESPLRCELIFVSHQIFPGLKWGTREPVLAKFSAGQPIPIRAYGTYNLHISNSELFFKTLMGSRTSMELHDIDDYVQAQIQQVLPEALEVIPSLDQLNTAQPKVASKISALTVRSLLNYGLQIGDIRILSLVPTEDTLHALDEKAAMQVIGDPQKYMLYKMANSFGAQGDTATADPLHMMMGLMVGRGFMGMGAAGAPASAAPPQQVAGPAQRRCPKCGAFSDPSFRFCPHCGGGFNS